MLLINFKNYPQVLGPKALKLVQELAGTAKGYPKVSVGFAPPPLELAEVAAHTRTNTWAQHVDPVAVGQTTGFLSPQEAKEAGAFGTFLNHSEHPLDNVILEETLKMAQEVDLRVLVFAKDPETIAAFASLKPDFIAYEPPELIGGDISVSQAKPNVISEALAYAKDIPLLVGAGVHEKKDIEVAIKLGAIGAVVSSAVVTAPNPVQVFTDLLNGFKS